MQRHAEKHNTKCARCSQPSKRTRYMPSALFYPASFQSESCVFIDQPALLQHNVCVRVAVHSFTAILSQSSLWIPRAVSLWESLWQRWWRKQLLSLTQKIKSTPRQWVHTHTMCSESNHNNGARFLLLFFPPSFSIDLFITLSVCLKWILTGAF